jgi:hypothetical protein
MSDLSLDRARGAWENNAMTTSTNDYDALIEEMDAISDLIPPIDLATVIIMTADHEEMDAIAFLDTPLGKALTDWCIGSDKEMTALRRTIEIEGIIAMRED